MRSTVLWFLKRPRLYPELFRRSRRKVFPAPEKYNGKEQKLFIEEWCEKYSVDTQTAIFNITGRQISEPFLLRFEKTIQEAEEQVRKCPFKMGGRANLELLYQLAEYIKATRVIETGVGYGWSSLALLLSLQNREGAILYSTDMPYIDMNNDKWVGCVVPDSLRRIWNILKYADKEAIPRASKKINYTDLCHYDSDHTYEGRTWAYPKLWHTLRPGGIFISDDIGDNPAFHELCDNLSYDPIIIKIPYEDGRFRYQGVLIKPD